LKNNTKKVEKNSWIRTRDVQHSSHSFCPLVILSGDCVLLLRIYNMIHENFNQ